MQRDKLDNKYRRMSKVAKFIRRHISVSLGRWLSDRVDDAWSKSFKEEQ